jgi:hypothetical protein
MIKKDYMTPELEEIKMELQCPIMELSTPEGENNSDEIDDL